MNVLYFSWRLSVLSLAMICGKTILTDSIAFFYSRGLTSIVKLQMRLSEIAGCALINDVRPILKKDKRPFDTIRMI